MGSTEALPKELNRRRAAVGRVCVTATSLLLVRQNRLGRSLKSRVESACEHAIRNARGDGDCDDSSPRARDALHVLRCWRASCQSCQRGARACRALPPLAMPAAAATLQVGAEVVELLDEACFAPLRERFAAPAGFLAGAPLSAHTPTHPDRGAPPTGARAGPWAHSWALVTSGWGMLPSWPANKATAATATPKSNGIAAGARRAGRARGMLWGCDAAWRVASGIVGDRERHRSDSQTLEAARRAAEGGQPGRSF